MVIFIRIVFVVVKLKIAKAFLYQFVCTKLPFCVFEPLLPQILCDLSKTFTRGSIQADKKYFRIKNTLKILKIKNIFRFQVFTWMGRTKNV